MGEGDVKIRKNCRRHFRMTLILERTPKDDLFLNPKSFYAVVSMLFEDGKKTFAWKTTLDLIMQEKKKYESLAKASPRTHGATSAARGDTSCQIIQSTIVHIERCEYGGTNKFIYCNVECTPYRVDNKTVHIFCRSD